ncbi:MAG: histidine phosphatase family protein [Acidobacteriota bacterium]|nr:histidine phosphatase family protein [Acidobacteriota bacterium]
MKTLYVLRHAKSDWNDASLTDFERPLNERGLTAARKMGEFMRERGIEPDLIVSSPARRARETAQIVKDAAGFEANIRFERRIYEASIGYLIEIVSEVENDCRKLLIVGHNPGFEQLVENLTGELHAMPTAALAEIALPIESWSETMRGGKLKNLFKPKEI